MKGVTQTSLQAEEFKGIADDSQALDNIDLQTISSADNITTDADSSAPNNDLANLLDPNHIPALRLSLDKGGTEEEGDGTCQFCGISSPEFLSAEKMDLHYVLQC